MNEEIQDVNNEISNNIDNTENNDNTTNSAIDNSNEEQQYTEKELLKQEHIVESILFMMGESVEVQTLAMALGINKKDTIKACDRLKKKCIDEHRGVKILKLENKYQMATNEEYFDNLVIVASNPKKPILTDAIMETLAIIAYKGPITKTEIEKIRGVSSEHTVSRLMEYKLIEEAGRLDAPGRPILFKTSEDFMRRFGIETADDLPTLSVERQAEIENEVKEEIKASFGDVVLDENNTSNETTSENNENNDEQIFGTKENPGEVEI